MKRFRTLLLVVGAFHGYNLIGIQPWCIISQEDKTIACNYEDRETCEAYRLDSEACIPNPKPAVKTSCTGDDCNE